MIKIPQHNYDRSHLQLFIMWQSSWHIKRVWKFRRIVDRFDRRFKAFTKLMAAVDYRMTGSVWPKSPESNIIDPPNHLESPRKSFIVRSTASKARLCAIVHSSQMMIPHSPINFAVTEFMVPVRVDLSTVRRFGSIKRNVQFDRLPTMWQQCQRMQ